MGASKHKNKTQRSGKTHHQNTPTVKTCKKTLSGRGQASEMNDGYTLFTVFSEAQGSHKTPEMEAKMEPRAPKITKNRKSKHSKKHQKITPQKVDNLLKFLSKWDDFFVAGTPQKSQQSQKSSQWTPGSPKRAPGP